MWSGRRIVAWMYRYTALINRWWPTIGRLRLRVHTLSRRHRTVLSTVWWWRRTLLRQRVTVWTVQCHALTNSRTTSSRLASKVGVGGMGGNEGLSLGRHGREHAVLVEPDAVAATTVLRRIKTGASNLDSKTPTNQLVE